MPEVTVLLPIHNGEAYVAEAIASVLSQDFRDFELHVLDDASRDGSAQIARATGDHRVRYSANPEHFGLFKTLNRGFAETRSRFVRLWAQDDRMLPGSLGRFVTFARAHPTAAMIYSDFFVVDAEGRRTGGEAAYASQRSRTPELVSPALSALLFWSHGCLPGNISTVMLRRQAWERTGGFLTGWQQAPDYDMWVRLSEQDDIGFIRERLVEVREHAHQLSKVGQREMSTIEQELPIIRKLEMRLSAALCQKDLDRGWITGRGRQHVQWIARAVARGDLAAALRGLRALRGYGRAVRQILFWLLSANGRFFTPSRDRIFDMAVQRVTGAPRDVLT